MLSKKAMDQGTFRGAPSRLGGVLRCAVLPVAISRWGDIRRRSGHSPRTMAFAARHGQSAIGGGRQAQLGQ